MTDLTEYRALSFDCYGTLIDWEAGLASVLRAWARKVDLDLSDEQLLLAYSDKEAAVMREVPSAHYPAILAEAFRRAGAQLGAPVSDEWAEKLGSSVPAWPAFPDSAAALASLGKHYDLIIVSNVHKEGFAGSNEHLNGEYAAIITAEDVRAYKPAAPHFEALDAWLQNNGMSRQHLLHVAQSLFHDHVPARRFSLDSVWINRRHNTPGWGATPQPSEEWTYNAEYHSMGEFATAVDEAFEAKNL